MRVSHDPNMARTPPGALDPHPRPGGRVTASQLLSLRRLCRLPSWPQGYPIGRQAAQLWHGRETVPQRRRDKADGLRHFQPCGRVAKYWQAAGNTLKYRDLKHGRTLPTLKSWQTANARCASGGGLTNGCRSASRARRYPSGRRHPWIRGLRQNGRRGRNLQQLDGFMLKALEFLIDRTGFGEGGEGFVVILASPIFVA